MLAGPGIFFLCIIYMINECQKFKTSRNYLLEIDSAYLDAFFRRLVPDEAFRFITFQQTDFRLDNLTFILYSYVPESVYVTVERATDFEAAFEELAMLNPGVYWEYGTINCFDFLVNGTTCMTAELKLTAIPMRVNKQGVLIAR